MNKNKIPLISIVIPVYNAAPYLVRCLDSVVEQTIENIEIIIVNDGSTDNSLEICEMYKEKDKRVVLINKQNGGLSDARNVGINMAKGQYIGFVDSDDWIRKNMFERLYAPFLENSNVDIAVCGYALVELVDKRVYKRKQICTINKEETYDSNIYKIVYSKDSDRALEVPVWNKLYRKKLFDNLKFEIGKINEDNLISLELYSKVKKIIHIPGYYYYYRFNDLGICRTKYSQKSLTILEAKERQIVYFKKKDKSIYDVLVKKYEIELKGVLRKIFISKFNMQEEREIIDSVKTKVDKFVVNFIDDKMMKTKIKMLFLCPNLVKNYYLIYEKIKKIYYIIKKSGN